MKDISITITSIFCLILVVGCKKDTNPSESACDDRLRSFATHVNPLIQTYCNQPNCHQAGSVNGPGPITNYTQVYANRVAIRSAVESGLMPQNTTLTAEQKNTIICWIADGAQDN